MKLDPRVSEIIERVTTREGMELVHAEMTGGKNPILRVYIDKPGGVTIDDYDWWKQRYGDPQGAGNGGLAAPAPEPSALTLLAMGALLAAAKNARRRHCGAA